MLRGLAMLLAAGCFAISGPTHAAAGANTLQAAKQFGLGYVQYMLMEDLKLVEKHAKAAGLGDVTVQWNTFRSSDVMNDALLSGSVQFVSLGVPGLMTIWDRTKGNIDVRGASALNSMPIALMVRDDSIKASRSPSSTASPCRPCACRIRRSCCRWPARVRGRPAGKLDTIAITRRPDALSP
jgi:NitT/TauT family transport system substrate-binding protein